MTSSRILTFIPSLLILSFLPVTTMTTPASATIVSPYLSSSTVASLTAPASSLAREKSNPTVQKVEEALHRLKLPVGAVDGIFDGETQKGICAWRALTGREESRFKLSAEERTNLLSEETAMMGQKVFSLPKKFVTGINISKTCQVLYWVEQKDGEKKTLRGVFKVSTGTSGHTTPSGIYHINRQINGWHESTKYAGAMMYRPKYFNGGIALHGSITDSYVLPYPASHGCVRMLHKDVDKLWRAGVSMGTTVQVYGEWGQ